MSARHDVSECLIHFTSGDDDDAAYRRLCAIIYECRILGSGRRIREGYSCVCFTEAPLDSLPQGFVNPTAYSRYSAFGVIVEKRWLFELGGRPVIYQPDAEYELLPAQLRWRHVRFEPGSVDFTWEREWRIQCAELPFTPHQAGIAFPTPAWAARLVEQHEREQDFQVLQYSQIMNGLLAEQYRESLPWRVYSLT